jgi:hypothetical protein
MKEIFDMPLAQSIVKSLSDNLSSRVLSFLDPLRNQYASKHGRNGLHLCTHIREGNNEIGDWERKSWRHIDLHSTLNNTLAAMKDIVFSTQATTGKYLRLLESINMGKCPYLWQATMKGPDLGLKCMCPKVGM